MDRFAQLLDALAEKEHVLTLAAHGGDRTLADRTRRDARAIRGDLGPAGLIAAIPTNGGLIS